MLVIMAKLMSELEWFLQILESTLGCSAGFIPSSGVHQSSVLTSWACNAPRWYWGQFEVGCFQKSFKNPLPCPKAGENLLSPPLLQSSGTNSLYRQEKDGEGRGPAREVTGHLLSFCYSAAVGPVLLTLCFLFLFSLVCSWLATLCLCQMYSKLVQLSVYRNLLLFKFFSHLGYYRILGRVPCAIQ